MNIMIIIGFLICALTGIIDRFVYKMPDLLAIVLYSIALIMFVAGMIRTRKKA